MHCVTAAPRRCICKFDQLLPAATILPTCIPWPLALQLKAAVAAVTAERDELQGMVQQAAAEMQAVQHKVEEGSSQQVGVGVA